MLGRPFGVPHDAAFQERVLLAALRLLEAPSGPVLTDYPEEAPEAPGAPVACPVTFQTSDEDTGSALLREIEALRPWHDRARERRGRSMVGVSGLDAPGAAQVIARFLQESVVATMDGLTAAETIRLACEDLRTYCCEAAAARPGTPDPDVIQHWFWHETAAGGAIRTVHSQCLASPDPSLQRLCRFSLVPRAVLQETTA